MPFVNTFTPVEGIEAEHLLSILAMMTRDNDDDEVLAPVPEPIKSPPPKSPRSKKLAELIDPPVTSTKLWGSISPPESSYAIHDLFSNAITDANRSLFRSTENNSHNNNGNNANEGGGRPPPPKEDEHEDHDYPGANPNFITSPPRKSNPFSTKNAKVQSTKSTTTTPKVLTSPFFETLKLLLPKNPIKSESTENDSTTEVPLEALDSFSPTSPLSTELRNSVILILTHAGFDATTSSVLDTLTDLLEYYIETFCTLLRQYTDSEDLKSPVDFADTVDKVLHHMNVPDLDALRKFEDTMTRYYEKTKKRAQGTRTPTVISGDSFVITEMEVETKTENE